jgi:glutamate/tyrosine decarboxylase-like PLP-dependent enzyme
MKETDLQSMLEGVAAYAAKRRDGDAERLHRPEASYDEQVERFALDVDAPGVPGGQAIAELVNLAEPGLHVMTGPRFFGWVIGASNPVGVAADWLTSAWGQNAGNHQATPSAAAAEFQAGRALLDLLDLPREASVGFVTGATMANFTCLAAARGAVLRKAGWDVEADGLFGAPPITVIIGEEAHSTVFAALKYLGLGASRVVRVAVDDEGAMLPQAFAQAIEKASGPIITIVQAGQINTGAFDPFAEIVKAAKAKGAWVHVDGAFGLWARAIRMPQAAGLDAADSWAVDGHKWLQTPYDCGYAIVRDREAHERAMQIAASYLPSATATGHNPADYAPELSRRARGFATWAMIRHLGRRGVQVMVERACACARQFAELLAAEPGVRVLNKAVLNQVIVRFGDDDEKTKAVIARIQSDGVCFTGGANWHGQWVMRISVTSENTTPADVDRSVGAMLEAWRAVRGRN